MSIGKLLLVGLLALSTWANYHSVGKPREPMTIATANWCAVINGGIALWVTTS